MGITLEQLLDSISKVKQYASDKFPVVSPREDNAILYEEDGIFVEDKQQQNINNNTKVDVIINFTSKTTSRLIFAIYFNRKDSHYYLYNLNTDIKANPYIMQVKINHGYLLKQNSINHNVL